MLTTNSTMYLAAWRVVKDAHSFMTVSGVLSVISSQSDERVPEPLASLGTDDKRRRDVWRSLLELPL